MDQTVNVNLNETLNRLFEKLVVQVTNNVYELHFMRESVQEEQEHLRTEELKLQDLGRRCAEAARQEERAGADQATARCECEKQIEEFTKDTTQNCEAALEAEVSQRIVAAMTVLIAEREKEVATLRRDDQSRQLEDSQVGATVAVNVAADQIMWAAREITTKIQDISNRMSQLERNHRDVQSIVHKLSAYKEARRISGLQKKCYFQSLSAQNDKLRQHLTLGNTGKFSVIQSMPSPVASLQKDSVRSSAIWKELEAEKFRGAELVKELCEVTLQASAKAARREKWLNEQVHGSTDNNSTEE